MPTKKKAPVKIVVYQRGWVCVGRFSQDGETVILENASVIRRWGTAKGLGELALSGPKPQTILDPTGTVRAHVLTTVLVIDCMEASWPGV